MCIHQALLRLYEAQARGGKLTEVAKIEELDLRRFATWKAQLPFTLRVRAVAGAKFVKEIVRQSFNRGQAIIRLEAQKRAEEREVFGRGAWNDLRTRWRRPASPSARASLEEHSRIRPYLLERCRLEVGKAVRLIEAVHGLDLLPSRRPEHLDDLDQLVDPARAGEQDAALDELSEDAPDSPKIDGV